MKKHTQFSLFIALLLCLTTTAKTFGQDVDKELHAFAQNYQTAYNNEDVQALKGFYTTDAQRIAQDTLLGNEAIVAKLAQQFASADVTIEIVQESIHWSDANTAYVSLGKYHLKGKNTAGKDIRFSGSYTNVMLKENGVWKITKSILK